MYNPNCTRCRLYRTIGLLSLVFVLCTAFLPSPGFEKPFYELTDTRWADSVFNSLSPDERIAQLFMVAAYSNRDKKHAEEIEQLITDYKIGGLIFFQGGPVRQAVLTNRYQAKSKVPLLISIDGEWGLAMRLDSTPSFPRQMALGAIKDETLVYEMGREIAYECKRLGIHINFAPVADINNNPNNPVIGTRSFGEDKYNVTRKALAYMKGMQDAGVMANAKHFPGHGDTDSDSHKTLPVISHSQERIDTLELYPFKEMMKQGLGSLMVAHLFIPSIDSTKNTASTLSKAVVTDLLKNKLQFKGLVFTDALNMKGVSKFYEPGMVDVKAILAGNDVLLFAENIPTAIKEIKKALERGEITQEEIDIRCRKILYAKQWCGLNHYQPVELKNLYEDLNNKNADLLNRKLAEAAVTLLSNKNNLIPLTNLDTLRIATLSLGYNSINEFQKTASWYAPMRHFSIDKEARKPECDTVVYKLKSYNLVIVNVNNTNNSPKKDFGLTPAQVYVLKMLKKKTKVIVNVAANPYILGNFKDLEDVEAVILSYEPTYYFQHLSAQLIFGAISATAKLPVSASAHFRLGMGITTGSPIRFKYTVPEELNIDSRTLDKIDSIALNGIKEKAYPGCQVLVAKDGKIFYQKSFGYHTYDNKRIVKNDDLYDIASITKIVSSTASLMKLVDERKVAISGKLGDYLSELDSSNKKDIFIREMLAHQARLRDWIPFWQRTVTAKTGDFKKGFYHHVKTDSFPVRVAENLYLQKSYPDSLYQSIIRSPLLEEHKYKYSDLGYYFLKRIIEKQGNTPLAEYVQKTFYNPLGLTTMGYKPRERFELSRIIPTENDTKFRKQVVHGDVHDPGAAMLGGVGGHAGIFSNANDLAVMMQLFLNKGEYGGKRYLDSATVNEFTRCQYCIDNKNRRGIGFDKPDTLSPKDSPVCSCVSYLSYGHQGFTGTLAWADPGNGLVYIFLSNRVHPEAEPNKLLKLGVRSKIQEVIYEAVK